MITPTHNQSLEEIDRRPPSISVDLLVLDISTSRSLALGFDDLGPQAVKNRTDEVGTFRVRLTPGAAASRPRDATASAAPNPMRSRLASLGAQAVYSLAVIGLLLAINLFSNSRNWWFQWPALGLGFALLLRAIRLYLGPPRRS